MRVPVLLCAVCVVLLAGCPARTSVYSPRMHNTDFHRDAAGTKNCRDCHDPGGIEHHSPQDDCTSCHTVCRGC